MGLCLSRKTGETIVIAGSIVIRVGEIGRGRVRLDVEAPAEVNVHRGEVQQRLDDERKPAA